MHNLINSCEQIPNVQRMIYWRKGYAFFNIVFIIQKLERLQCPPDVWFLSTTQIDRWIENLVLLMFKHWLNDMQETIVIAYCSFINRITVVWVNTGATH